MKTEMAKTAALLVLSAIGAVPAFGQDAASGGTPTLAKDIISPRYKTAIRVTSGAISPGLPLADRYTQNGADASLPLTWTRGPNGTRSYVVLLEDGSVNRPEPIAHWVAYDIPPSMRRIPGDQPKETQGGGFLQGLNIAKEPGYMGPKPPEGEDHVYHVEVFALNTMLRLDPSDTDRDDVVDAMKGHVLATGDLAVHYPGD